MTGAAAMRTRRLCRSQQMRQNWLLLGCRAARLSTGLGGEMYALPALPSQEETPQGEGAEQEQSTPDTEEDGRRHGFLILSREDSTMVRGVAEGCLSGGPLQGVCLTTVAHRSCRLGRRSWSWTPVALPHKAPQSLPATSGTIATSCKCHRSASAFWKEVGPAGGRVGGWAGGRVGGPAGRGRGKGRVY